MCGITGMCGMYLLQMNSLEATNNHLTREDTQTKQKEKNHHMSIITEHAHYNNDCNAPRANGFVQDIINYNGEEGIHICPYLVMKAFCLLYTLVSYCFFL